MASQGYVALFGEFLNERMKLNTAARGFGWSTRQVCARSAEIADRRAALMAVLIHPQSLAMPWKDALQVARAAAPNVRVVICHGEDDLDSQPEMTASGAFYTLLLPSDSRELQFLFKQLDSALRVSFPQPQVSGRIGLTHRMAGAA